ncbi:arylsulfatase [Bradyrhizobium sp. CCBAU 51765]|uniref:arylsulfatase n=1 Tax=Bradyrhizobium sp. CCBAU 51765 TaxID=1325102 RepID=UPI0018C0E348|nr:arylsulfatase [Bradyrhizobium sp. CCBAU 51765]QOZ12390.1 arylsulfatase [Bradyrhizobium sp. CCBAU 51765]
MSTEKDGDKSNTKASALDRRRILLGGTALAATSALVAGARVEVTQAQAQQPAPAGQRPNILVIWGDDVGVANISAYTFGLMGYKTPNIDRIAREGLMFTDYYAEQSCTAGRASFLTGQSGLRTGMTKVGLPGAAQGLRSEDITIAEALKPLGYATGQFGKNHLGDRNEFLPTVHGFDEFFGNLYHLNAEEEPEHPDYPKDPGFKAKFGPRGVLRCRATDRDDPTVDPRFGKVGKQTIEDTGPLTKKRMETVDDETSNAAIDFIKRQVQANKPFFCWHNGTRMHLYTHVRPEYKGRSGLSEYMDGMLEHDGHVGNLLKALDDLGIANNTIVIYGTDNGVHMNSWPDGGMTPFRSEKNTNWEGAYRVPAMIRWPGRIKPGQVSNEIFAALDWFPTLLAAAGEPDIKNKLLTGYAAAGRTFKVHLDGYNQLPLLTGQQEKSARKEFFYINDDAQLVAMRHENWKMVFCEQKVQGTLEIWAAPFVCRRLPKMFNLRLDPYERADVTSNTYYDWTIQRAFLIVPAQAMVAQFVETFKDFPPRQKPSSFSVDEVLAQMSNPHGG